MFPSKVAVTLALAAMAVALPLETVEKRQAPWYKDSSATIAEGLEVEKRQAPWYKDSPAASAEALEVEKRQAPWYKDSPAASADAFEVEKRQAPWYKDSPAASAEALEIRQAPWYKDSPAASAEALETRQAPWYKDSPAASAEALETRQAPWYKDSPAASAEALETRQAPWYKDSPAASAEALEVEKRQAPWYKDSPAASAEALEVEKRQAPWYKDAPAAINEGLEARSPDAFTEKSEKKMNEIKRGAYENMRTRNLRSTSENGKAFFQFTPHPRNDTVDRWHIPTVIQKRYEVASSDADRVSVLNNYLYATARTPKSATELGFTPTMMMPGLPEGRNEVGFGYALEGQHQYHCVDFLADAIEIGKSNVNDFYLKHIIHCLGLLKVFAEKLTDPQPLTLLSPEAEALIKAKYKQTID